MKCFIETWERRQVFAPLDIDVDVRTVSVDSGGSEKIAASRRGGGQQSSVASFEERVRGGGERRGGGGGVERRGGEKGEGASRAILSELASLVVKLVNDLC